MKCVLYSIVFQELFRAKDPTLDDRMIRINPNRTGADTIIRILTESMKKVKACSLKK